MKIEMSPPLSAENFEIISALRVMPLVASPSVMTRATTGRAGSRGIASTPRSVRKTSVCPCAVSRAIQASAFSNASFDTSIHAVSGKA